MGLDVYLNRVDNYGLMLKVEQRAEQELQKIYDEYPDYSDMTQDEKEEAREKTRDLYARMGLDEDWGEYLGKESIRIPSEKYPDHLFDVGYFRSSYNQSGFNNICRMLGVPDLYEVFDPGDTYTPIPEWDKSLGVARKGLKMLQEINSDVSYRVISAASYKTVKASPSTEREALNVFKKNLEEKTRWTSYRSSDGLFFLDGVKVVAAIEGSTILGDACQYLIEETPPGKWDSYVQAYEVVIETIEYVLDQDDGYTYYFAWSR